MYFNSVHGKNIQLSADSSQARRVTGFCQGITFSNNPLTPLQRITFLVGSKESLTSRHQPTITTVTPATKSSNNSKRGGIGGGGGTGAASNGGISSSRKSLWNGNLRIGLTTKNPVTLTLSDLPEFSYPSLLNTDGFWITCIKSSYLRHGNKLSLVLDEKNSLQLAINYVVKATLFGNGIIPNTLNLKLWLLLDIYGNTNVVQFLATDDTPYEIKQRGLDAVNNFHSACLIGGSRSIYKTRLFVLGQDEVGKSSLKSAFLSKSKNSKKSSKQQHRFDTTASFRVKIDNSSNSWIVKPLHGGEQQHKTDRRYARKHSGVITPNTLLQQSGPQQPLGRTKSISESDLLDEVTARHHHRSSKHRSTSTSYLNEEDDYDNNFCSKEDLRTFRRQLSLESILGGRLTAANEEETTAASSGDELSSAVAAAGHQQGIEMIELNSDHKIVDKSDERSQKKKSGSKNQHGGNNSSGSSRESSDTEYDSDNNEDLYAIDEFDESIASAECDPVELKKDPTGYHYKRIAFNIYQELFTTKLFDKLWPQTSLSTGLNNEMSMSPASHAASAAATTPLIGNNFSESFFEKLALMEYETSVYNKLLSGKILCAYYEQIVYEQMKMLKQNRASTIMVTPAVKSVEPQQAAAAAGNENNLLSAEVKNIMSVRKKLSLTILDLDDRSYQIFLSSRAVYLVCFDLTQDLNGLAQTNFSYGFEKNGELTNLDYLDFIFKSIHFHTAKIPDSAALAAAAVAAATSLANFEDPTRNDIDEQTQAADSAAAAKQLDFKYATLSPPIIIIGTNKNGVTATANVSKDELIRLKFQKIRELLANRVYSNHIVEPYFAIDNASSRSGGELDAESLIQAAVPESADGEIDALKRVIELVSLNEPYMGEQLPLKWMKFEKSLDKLKNKGLFYASLSQICEIAHEKDIKTQEELTTCLNFLNDLGTIIYYGNANDIFLRNTIILRPQKLVEIFNMILDARMPNSLVKLQQQSGGGEHNSGGSNETTSGNKWLSAWEKFNKRGILNDSLLDVLWKSVINQKPGLLGLMKKFDLICDRNMTSGVKVAPGEHMEREYLVPSRAKISYDEDFEEEMSRLKSGSGGGDKGQKKYFVDSDYEDYDSENEIEDLNEKKKSLLMMNQTNENTISVVEFYYDFCGFLPEALFHRIVTRIARWTLMKTGTDYMDVVRMYYRKARFYLDENHDFTVEMAPLKYARIKIQIIRLSKMVHGYMSAESPPEPNSCAKVRNFMESTLIDLRNLWIKRLNFNACVLCSCDKPCDLHQLKMCTHFKCMHFLNLDECLTNNIVTCEYRRVKTYIYKSWFPTQNISLHKGPVLSAIKTYSDKNMFYDEKTLPNWVKNIAKLLQATGKDASKDKEQRGGEKDGGEKGGGGGGSGQAPVVTVNNENDWIALARLLGYNKSKINYFTESENPALQLICDWIMSSDNTNLTIEFLINYLEQLKREDVIKIINNEREKETVNSSVFLSYQWDFQEEVLKIKENLEKAGFKCFMDVGQIGGGNLLYQKIDQAIRNSKVVIACITPKFVVSHFCNREMALADLLRKPIVPIMLAPTPWPPPGGMGLIFSQLVYVDYFGVGGHGGVGKNADREQRNNEIVALVARHVDPSSYFLMNIDRITDNESAKHKPKKSLLTSLMPLGRNNNTSNYHGSPGFVDEANTANGALTGGLNRQGTLPSANAGNLTRMSMRGSMHVRGGLAGPALGAAGSGGGGPVGGVDNQNQANAPRCAVCCLL